MRKPTGMRRRACCLLLAFMLVAGAVIIQPRSVLAAESGLFLVSPSQPDILTMHPVFRTVQTSTELDGFPASSATGAAAGQSLHGYRTGFETWINGRANLIGIPFEYCYDRFVSLQADLPFLSYDHTAPGGETTEYGLGDLVLTVKLRTVIEGDTEMYYLVSTSFPSGDEDKGLGSGGFQFSYTQKLTTRIAGYRTSFMAGVIIPTPGSEVRVGDGVVSRKPIITWMAAAERALGSYPKILASLRLTGFHGFHSPFNEVSQKNSLSAVDLVPGVRYAYSPTTALTAGVGIPLLTVYDLPGARNYRNPYLSLGVSRSF